MNENGSIEWNIAGTVADKHDLSTASELFVNQKVYDDYGNLTEELTDTSAGSSLGFVPAPATRAKLEELTTYSYDSAFGLTKIIYPNGTETHIKYRQDGDKVEQWTYEKIIPAISGNPFLLDKPVTIKTFYGSQLVSTLTVQLTDTD